MAKWTLDDLTAHRDCTINKHYRNHGSAPVLAIYFNRDEEIIAQVYPSTTLDRFACRLCNAQIDHFMSSTEFDKPLFETLVTELGLRADAALMMSLS